MRFLHSHPKNISSMSNKLGSGLRLALGVGLLAAIIMSCTKNIEPFPDSVNMAPSMSLPIGECKFNISEKPTTSEDSSINLNEDVPDWAKNSYVYIQEPFALNLSEVYNQADSVTAVTFKINVWNEFPLTVDAQVWLRDSNHKLLDSLLLPTDTVPAAEIYPDGTLAVRKHSTFTVILDKDGIEELKNVSRVIIRAGIRVTDEGINAENVKYFDQYTLRVHLAARIDFRLTLSN